MSSQCTDDENSQRPEKFLWDELPLPPPPGDYGGSCSSLSNVFSIGVTEDTEASFSSVRIKRVNSFVCGNCGCSVRELVFDCACSVECALGFHSDDVHVTLFIAARYHTVPAYKYLRIVPSALPKFDMPVSLLELLGIHAKNMYLKDDPRRKVYEQQITRNIIIDGSRIKR